MIERRRLFRWIEAAAGSLASFLALVLSYRFCVEAGPLWRDEVSTVNLATLPRYADVFGALRFDSAPALYPTLVRIWTTLMGGADDVHFRFFGLIVAAGTVAAAWIAVRSLGVGIPLLTLVLFDLHGRVVQTLGSVKPYGLGALLLALTFAAIGRMVLIPSLRSAGWAAVAAILSVQTLYQNALLLVGPFAAAIAITTLSRDWKAARLIVATGVLAALSLLPYTGVVIRSQDWRPLNQIDGDFLQLIRQVGLTVSYGKVALGGVWVVVCVIAVAAALRTLSSRKPWTPEHARTAYAALTLMLTTGVYLAFLRLVAREASPWHLVPLMLLAALCVDLVLGRSLPLGWARVSLAAVAGIVLVPIAMQWMAVRQTNIDLLATYLQRTARSGDTIVVLPWFLGISFQRYYHGEVPSVTVPPIEDLRTHRYDLLKAQMMASEPLAPVFRAMTASLESGHRVWLVGGAQFPRPGEVVKALPPAPAAPSGWRDAPYYLAWSRQTGEFVLNRAERISVVQIRAGQPVWLTENVDLVMVEGWRPPPTTRARSQ